MAKSNPQAIDYPYPTTNTPPLTTHHALIACEAVRRVCLCDDNRDAKEDDCDDSDVLTSEQFSWKQLRNATIVVPRRQKPLTNALNGLYLPCVDRMLEARWFEGCDESLPRRTGVWRKSHRGLSFAHDGVGFHPTEVAIYLPFRSFNVTEGRDGLSFSYLLFKFKILRVRL